eukprot:TRINITY_DN44276_c0_g1_i1.p1 TRINITY_DN44276_c0_g1~~TRINITY_DN44276_c0_g1_i1.p1  ORF type:complete len:432 (-),score=68.65 TRINITY_DN44276_c0_g1_i1:64-1359(-)
MSKYSPPRLDCFVGGACSGWKAQEGYAGHDLSHIPFPNPWILSPPEDQPMKVKVGEYNSAVGRVCSSELPLPRKVELEPGGVCSTLESQKFPTQFSAFGQDLDYATQGRWASKAAFATRPPPPGLGNEKPAPVPAATAVVPQAAPGLVSRKGSFVSYGDIVSFPSLQKANRLSSDCGIVEGWDQTTQRWRVRTLNGQEIFTRSEDLSVERGFAEKAPTLFTPSKHHSIGVRQKQQQHQQQCADEPGTGRKMSGASVSTCVYSDRRKASEDSVATEDAHQEAGVVSTAFTTVMMRNIPSEFSGEALINLLNAHGFKSSYDLVYLPMDYQRKVGFGYSFINFISAEAADHFRQTFQNFRDWGVESDKVCEVCWGNALQGIDAHIERYRNSPVMHEIVPDAFKPMLFKDGERVPFPAPTKSIRPPRLRKKESKA